MVMSEFDLERTIHDLRDAIVGDLRLDAAGRADVVDLVDQSLAGVPGKNMVPADWWRDQLDMFELVAINPTEPVG